MRSEHRSTAVRAYKQLSQSMLRGISNSPQPPKPATVTSATLETEEATSPALLQPLPGNIPPSPPAPPSHTKNNNNTSTRSVPTLVVLPGIDTVCLERNGKKLRISFDF